MTIVRRSNRINASTNRRSPRFSKCVYGSHYSYHSTIPKNTNRARRALKVKDNQKKLEKNINQYKCKEIVLKVLRSRPIMKKEYYQLNKRTIKRRVPINSSYHVLKKKATSERRKSKAVTSPPQLRRSKRKINVYFGNKLVWA